MQSLGKKQDQLLSSFEISLSSLEMLTQRQYKKFAHVVKFFFVEITNFGLATVCWTVDNKNFNKVNSKNILIDLLVIKCESLKENVFYSELR